MGKYKWFLISSDLGMGIECENCGHKISLKDYEMADMRFDFCPFCKEEMDLDSIDDEEVQDLLEGEFYDG